MQKFALVDPKISPSDIAKYILYRSFQDGELVSPLKLQKLVYYAYSWTLVNNKKRLFDESIQAWPNGPVVPSLYHLLKQYGSSPIPGEFVGITSQEEFEKLSGKFPKEIKDTLDKTYEQYMTFTAFELVVSTHSEKPWKEARKGLDPTDRSNVTISDELILEQYGQPA